MADLKAQLEISADATGVEAGVSKAKRSLADLGVTAASAGKKAADGLDSIGKGGDQSAVKLDAATRNMIGSIQRTTAAMEAGGRTSSKYYEALAAQRGIDVNALKPYLDQLDAATKKNVDLGLSAKQTTAALRQVPAQLTDIVVSLQGGQAPMTVLLQQGGQLKDVFGGIGPAARALSSYVIGLIGPFTLAAGGAAALAAAYYQGSKEADAYNRALIITGNAAGTTAGQLAQMAENLSESVGTQGAAAAALTELAGTGRIAAENLEEFARVAAQMEKTVGQSIQATAKDLSELAKAPLEASIKLNEQYRYLTKSVYDQIKALEDQGRVEEAAAVAQKAYADAFDERSQKIQEDLGYIERGWAVITNEAKRAWDAMLGLGRKETLSDLYDQLNFAIASGASEAEIADFEKRIAKLKDEEDQRRKVAEAQSAQVKLQQAQIQWDQEGEKLLDKKAKKEKEIAQARELARQAGITDQSIIDERIRQIEDKYKDKGAISAGLKIDKATLTADIESVRNAFSALSSTYDNAEKILEARRSAGLVSEAEYWEAKREFIRLNEQAEAEALQKQIERLSAEKATGDQKIKNDEKIAELMAEMGVLRAKASSDIEILSAKEAAANERVKRSYDEARQAAEQYVQSIEKRYARELEGIGRGTRYRDRQAGRNQIDDKYDRQRQDLAGELRRNEITQEQYDQQLAIIDEYHAKAAQSYEDYYARIEEAQSNWVNGATEAIQNYLDQSRNVAKLTEDLFTSSIRGMEDALVDFVTTGKTSFSDLATSIIANIVRMQIRAQMSSIFGGVLGAIFPSAAPAVTGAATSFAGPTYSAAGGFDIPSGVNPAVQLHQREMVLPEQYADVIRGLAAGGGGSGGNVSIQIIGAPSRPSVQETTDSRGNRDIKVVFGEMAGAEMRRPGSAMNQSARASFGLQPALVRR